MDSLEVAAMLKGGGLRDVFVAGFIDDERLVFCPLYDRIYFVFEDKKIEMRLDKNCEISFETVEEIKLWFELDDERFCIMSVFLLIFGTDSSGTTITSFTCDNKIPECRIRFIVGENEKETLFNPLNRFGFSFELKSVNMHS